MKKAGLLTISLLLATAMAVAQQSYPSSSTPSSPDQTAVSQQNNANSVQGCLSGSDGNFTLTDQSGATYTVQGDSAKLRDHVGHTVQISGTISGGSSSDQTASSTSSQKTIQLTDVKMIADNCKSGSTVPQSDMGSAKQEDKANQATSTAATAPATSSSTLPQTDVTAQSSTNPQNATNPPATNPEQPAVAPPVTSETPAKPAEVTAETQAQTANPPVTDQNATAGTKAITDESATGGKNLPQTATPLPLLALLGLGSLSGGLLARKKK